MLGFTNFQTKVTLFEICARLELHTQSIQDHYRYKMLTVVPSLKLQYGFEFSNMQKHLKQLLSSISGIHNYLVANTVILFSHSLKCLIV